MSAFATQMPKAAKPESAIPGQRDRFGRCTLDRQGMQGASVDVFPTAGAWEARVSYSCLGSGLVVAMAVTRFEDLVRSGSTMATAEIEQPWFEELIQDIGQRFGL